MRRWAAPLALASIVALACHQGEPGGAKGDDPPKPSLGGQAGAVISDTQTLRAANAAAGEVVRNAQDCAAVHEALPAANDALDEAERNVKTASGKQSVETLRKQVAAIADACTGVGN